MGIEARLISCKPTGCPASRNLAASYATGDLLFFLDNDATIAKPDGLGSIVRCSRTTCGLPSRPSASLLEDSPAFDPFAWVFRRPKETWELRTFNTFTFAGAGFLARASAHSEVGGFWERLTYSREEEETSQAPITAGWHLAYCPSLTVRHDPSSRGQTEVRKRRSIELVNGGPRFGVGCLCSRGDGDSRAIGTMTGKSLISEPRSLAGLWRSVGSALGQVVTFGEPRHPISFAAVWRYAMLHFDRGAAASFGPTGEAFAGAGKPQTRLEDGGTRLDLLAMIVGGAAGVFALVVLTVLRPAVGLVLLLIVTFLVPIEVSEKIADLPRIGPLRIAVIAFLVGLVGRAIVTRQPIVRFPTRFPSRSSSLTSRCSLRRRSSR